MGVKVAATFGWIGDSHNSKQEGIEFGALPKVTPMTNQNCLTSACRYCRFYRPEGMHGGACQQLNASVQSDWKACQLALPAFANTWENAEELNVDWHEKLPKTQRSEKLNVVSLDLSRSSASVNN